MKKKTITLLLFLSFIFIISAQDVKQDNIQTNTYIGFDELVHKLENMHNIKLFYKQVWFIGKLFRPGLIDLPVENCIAIIKKTVDLDCIKTDNNTYIFVPYEIRNYTNRINNKGVVLIGETNESSVLKTATVSGRILDNETRKPLPGARINIDKLNLVEYSNDEGYYSITIPPGEYDLRLNFSEYKENSRAIQVNGDGIVDFELAEYAILLREVFVTDRAADMNISTTQMSSIKLSAKAIKELPLYLGEKDIIKSVTLLPGVQSSGEFGTGFYVRGGGSDQNLILLEDAPIFNSSHLFGLNSTINPDGVKSVSLYKAGVSAQYGERVSSVMDIRLNNNIDKLAVKGGIGLLNSRLSLELPLLNKKISWLIGGRSSYSNWLLHAMPDVSLKKSSAGFYDINSMIAIKFNSKNTLSLFGYLSNDEFSFTENSPYQYDNRLASIKYTHTFNHNLNSNLIISHSRYRNNISQSDLLKPAESYKISSSVLYNQAKLLFSWTPSKTHTLDFGFGTILYQIQPGKLTPLNSFSQMNEISTNIEHAMESSVFISDNFDLTTNISAEIGIRFTNYAYLGPNSYYTFKENVSKTIENINDTLYFSKNQVINRYNSFEPRISLRNTIDKFSSIKFSYNRMGQFINLISNTSVMSPTDVYKLSNPNVSPLFSHQFAFGYFRNFEKNSYETSIEIYYKKLNNIIEYRDGAKILLNNALDADLISATGNNYGIEFFVRKNSGKLTGWTSYTFSRSLLHTNGIYDIDKINQNKVYPSNFDRPHNFILNATMHLTRRWRVAGIFNYSTGKPITLPELKYNFNDKQYIYYSERNKYRMPDYHRLDIAVSYDETLKLKQSWKGSWTLSILNLYGQKNPYSVFYQSNSKLESKFYQKFNLYQLFIIERPIPTITYNFIF